MQLRAHHAAPPGDDAQARAYLNPLATSGPFAGPPSTTTARTAHPELLATSGQLAGPPSTTTAKTAYLNLLATSGQLAGPPTTIAAGTAHLDLVASGGPLRTTPSTASGHHVVRASPIASVLRGRRGRRAVMATLAAGISFAGLSVAAVSANQVQAAAPRSQTKPISTASPTGPTIASGLAGVASIAAIEPPPEAKPKLSFTHVQRKTRPVPAPVPLLTANWVNPLPEAAVTSCFGGRWGRLHAGVDLAAPNGTRIRAAGAGVVVAAGVAAGYGNAVLIDHGNGYLTHYGHMSAIMVLVGQRVAAGQEIGLEGSTGNSTGPHLHFEVHQGSYRNPIEPTGWLREHGVEIPGCSPRTVPAEPAA